MQTGGVFWQPSAGEHYCARPASSFPRPYGRDRVYLQAVGEENIATQFVSDALAEHVESLSSNPDG